LAEACGDHRSSGTISGFRTKGLQDRLLAGDECRYDRRSSNTVNSMIGAVMAFGRFCHGRGWIPSVPPVEDLDVDDVMKGRPITTEEFERMLEVTPAVVGSASAESWRFALWILWESACGSVGRRPLSTVFEPNAAQVAA
jgi:hypothetical protein